MKTIYWIAGSAAALVAMYVAAVVIGGSDVAAEADAQVVYLCRETGQIVTGPPQPTPAVNPQTGRRTLYRALYCLQCREWRVVPPSQLDSGNPMSNVCPRHREPMLRTGPLPTGAAR